MNKQDFLRALALKLQGLPQGDINKSIDYYEEMIDDRIEDGLSEQEAVAVMGSIDDIVKQIFLDTPLPRLVKSKLKPKSRLGALEIILIILGFPLWFPLLISVAAVVLSVYIVLWSVVASLYAINLSVAAASVGVLALFVINLFTGKVTQGLLFLGVALICAGVAVLLFLLFGEITKGIFALTKTLLRGIKSMFIRKADENE